jgi:hypothetical protein
MIVNRAKFIQSQTSHITAGGFEQLGSEYQVIPAIVPFDFTLLSIRLLAQHGWRCISLTTFLPRRFLLGMMPSVRFLCVMCLSVCVVVRLCLMTLSFETQQVHDSAERSTESHI